MKGNRRFKILGNKKAQSGLWLIPSKTVTYTMHWKVKHYDCSLGKYCSHCMWKTNHLRILSKGRLWLSRCGERPEICIFIKLSGNAVDIARSLFSPSPPEWKTASLPWLIFFCSGEEKQWYSWLALWKNGDILFSKTATQSIPDFWLQSKELSNPESSQRTLLWFHLLIFISFSKLSFGLFRKSITEKLILFS